MKIINCKGHMIKMLRRHIDSFYDYLEKLKSKDGLSTNVAKIIFIIGKQGWVHSIIALIMGVIIPMFLDKGKVIFAIIFIVLAVLDILWAAVCTDYHKQMYVERRFSTQLLTEQSSLIKSLVIDIQSSDRANWRKHIFRTCSELACSKIYRIFKDVFKCETRVSVEFILEKPDKNGKTQRFVQMAGRKSVSRDKGRRPIPIDKKQKFYSSKIFMNNNNGLNILRPKEIDDANMWVQHNNHDVKFYWGIAVCAIEESHVDFIVQIDFLEEELDFVDKTNDEEIRKFIERNLTAYVNLIHLSYLLSLNGKNQIEEV